ncbi:MAG: TMF family protein [Pirellulaceae bacterium]|nr:TMF family protein [Pirellulaceae bacterium]
MRQRSDCSRINARAVWGNYLTRVSFVCAAAVMAIVFSGCGLLGSGTQLKQLQAENDKLVAEYRAGRERLAKLQAANADLEARVNEAEKLLARSGHSLPSSRLSQAPARGPAFTTPGANSNSGAAGVGSIPPYVPPAIPSLPNQGRPSSSSPGPNGSTDQDPVKWRPMRRQ